ncbi:MAG: UDP-glucose 4-epimerase [Crocinitomicaceae bacterium]|nr:UDP-glucose 4-epimerase [Crocinitomicaceae bacterium]
MTARVLITPEAEAVVNEIKARHGELMFHQSGGCCDGSQPMCYEKGDFKVGNSDVRIGNIAGCEFWMSKDQFEYWKHTQLTIDVTNGRGSSFSLEIPMGKRFIVKSRLYTADEEQNLEELCYLED